jgi:hypothetical protein
MNYFKEVSHSQNKQKGSGHTNSALDHQAPPEKPTIEYIVVEDGLNILDEVFNKLFEQIEKEINK